MPDLFPTPAEAEKDKALEIGIVNHLCGRSSSTARSGSTS
jgi:hypothetical protein